MVVPEDDAVSAFAVYSGKVKPSKNQKRRMKRKERNLLEKPLTKLEKHEIIKKKKEKKIISLGITDSKSPSKSNKMLKQKNLFSFANVSSGKSEKSTKKKKKGQKVNSINQLDITQTVKSSNSNETVEENISLENETVSNGGALKIAVEDITDNIQSENINFDLVHKKSMKHVKLSRSGVAKKKKDGSKKAMVTTSQLQTETENLLETDNLDTSIPASNSILEKVDSAMRKNKNTKRAFSSSEGSRSSKSRQSNVMHKLAEQAKKEVQKQSSVTHGQIAFQKILQSYNVAQFMRDNWEKKPVHIIGNARNKFLSLVSTNVIDSILRDNVVIFGKHLDVTEYINGKRETHNIEGRAHAHVVWDFYSNGCSVRLLNPQYFLNTVHTLNSHLQEYFGCFVGANVYLTPPNSQGFAPHYDDIEAFILQIEGCKLWKIYSPCNKDDYLPRYSSRNLTDEELGDPYMELKLYPGDVLYLPRGFIHQGRTENEHSLHITLSVYQKTAWCDLLEKLLPLTLKKAAAQDVEFRKGLPVGYLTGAGLAHKHPSQMRKQLVANLQKLVHRLTDFLEVDSAVDEMGLSYIKDALPPVLSPEEAACSVSGGGWRMEENGNLTNQVNFSLNTRVRWIRAHCYRILEEDVTLEDGSVERQTKIYYTLDNSREYHKEEPQFVILPPEMVPTILHLTSAYPEFTKISDLPGSDIDEKVNLIGDLWDRGLLMTDVPLEAPDSSDNLEEASDSSLTKKEMEIVLDLEESISGDEA